MIRNVLGSVLALIGAAAAVWSPFRAWYDGRHGRDYRVADLFGGIGAARADLATSLLLPFACAALLTLIALLLRSRPLVALAGVVVLGFTVLWMVRQGQAAGELSLDSDGSGLGLGVAAAAGGGVLLLLASAVMSGRPRSRARREPAPDAAGAPYGEPGRQPYEDTGQPYGRRDDQPYQEPYREPRQERYEEPYEPAPYGQQPGGPPDGPPTQPLPRTGEGPYENQRGPYDERRQPATDEQGRPYDEQRGPYDERRRPYGDEPGAPSEGPRRG
ncbi:hypothetical protein NX801_09450 [Streptomyces sp. LP05-1]|uniref:Integral membrane protein n=1 Tax=Streptomyces pyxinae TaxID=2970734 RepID=A0ABT2CEP9_9ACTN|nr:hypothetical protein [Streptomyces sp. LP05-1]MCS0635887.1 hypothetical protein [Streptomyces sp. LP05-1]